jgi:hypothetical protein
MDDLSGLDDIVTHLQHDEPSDARRLRNRFVPELRLLDDIGWERKPDGEQFKLTMPPRELRPIIERVYWSAVTNLNNKPHELDDDAAARCRDATTACPEMLARLADDDLDPYAQHCLVTAGPPSGD